MIGFFRLTNTKMKLLDGKKVAAAMYGKIKVQLADLKKKKIIPKLVIIQVGDDPASLSYIRSKMRVSESLGIKSELIKFEADKITTEKLIILVNKLNKDRSVNGILVQVPLPGHIYAPEVFKAINPYKDVDGFTAYNLGKTFLSTEFEELAPCTPLGIIRLLDYYKIKVTGKEAVVVGASNLTGKPMALMLINRRATVTDCHSKTRNLAEHTMRADILIVAVGKEKLITASMVKKGAVVIDIGINRNKDGKLVGDVDFEKVSKKASYITPVPGGAGPLTVATLMENIVKATLKQINKGLL